MKNVSLKQLRVFTTVARQSSFTRAADCLFMTQPAVSAHIRLLEQATGSPLFDRIGRTVRLTEAGQALLACVGEIERALEKAEESLAALKGARSGTLKVAAVNTAKYFAASLISAFSAQHSAVTVRFNVDDTAEILNQLVESQIDLVIVGRIPSNLEVNAAAFAQHPYVIIAPPGHALARLRRVAPTRLVGERFLSREPGSGARGIMQDLFHAQRIDYRPVMETNSNETIKQAVMAGMGIGCVSQHTVGLELSTQRLATLKVSGFPVIKSWYVISLRKRALSPVAVAFAQFLVEHGAAIIDGVMHAEAHAATTNRQSR